jgi:hypothetical protein
MRRVKPRSFGVRASASRLPVHATPTPQGDAMSDDMKNRGAQDRARINLGEEHEVRYWTQALGVSKDELAAAVKAVGPSADKVRTHLGK